MWSSKFKCSSVTDLIRIVSILWLFQNEVVISGVRANPDAKRLYDDLLSHYNRLIRPVSNNSQVVTVRLGLHLTQLIDLDLKNQILTTNVWVEHEWMDAKLTWDPEEYGGVRELMVPSDHIWLPDIVLYNNADGEYVVTTMTKAILYHDGNVKWNPPAIFKSYCEIDVRYFPFDTQTCFMKFGSWSYSGLQMDLKHIHSLENLVEIGMNLKDYYPSGEWDILDVPAERHARFYECCPNEFYADIFFNITLRRKTLFYTVNLIIPCVGISCLSVLTFYLPADSGEKVALCITTLLSQTMFFLLMSEIIPSTSLAMPLLGKYLLFTMCLVGLSVLITIVILNVRYRKPSTHRMSPWVRRFFIHQLPKMLLMRVPNQSTNGSSSSINNLGNGQGPVDPSALSSDPIDQTDHMDLAASVNTAGHEIGNISSHGRHHQGVAGSSLVIHDKNAARLAAAAARYPSNTSWSSSPAATRRWSRAASPYHYGSQLLCEIINHNAQHQQQQQEQHRQKSRYHGQDPQQQQQQHCQAAGPSSGPSTGRYQEEEEQQQLLLARLPPPPLTPSPISTITAVPVYPPPPPLSFLPPPPLLSSSSSSSLYHHHRRHHHQHHHHHHHHHSALVPSQKGSSTLVRSNSSNSSSSSLSQLGAGLKYETASPCKSSLRQSRAGAMSSAMADDVDVDIGLVMDGDSLDVGLAGGGASGAIGAIGSGLVGGASGTSTSGAGPMDGGANLMLRRRPNRVVKRFPLELQKAIRDVQFIQNHMKRADEYDEEDNDWGFIAMVLDRFFLWVFTVASLCGTISILFTAPALYDDSKPINLKYLGELGFY